MVVFQHIVRGSKTLLNNMHLLIKFWVVALLCLVRLILL